MSPALSRAHPQAGEGPVWLVELTGSEIACVEQDGGNLIVVLAAARVNGDRRQLDPALSGGHLQGVRWHLLQASWRGTPSALIGRIDEADWRSAPSLSAHGGVMLSVPSLGSTPAHLTLRTALGDALEVQAQAWLVELPDNGGLRPSLAC